MGTGASAFDGKTAQRLTWKLRITTEEARDPDLGQGRRAGTESKRNLNMTITRKQLKTERFAGIVTGRRLASVHPGAVLLSDFIEPLGITRYRVATAMGVQQRGIDEICAGTRAITAVNAVRLGLAFGIDPQFWLNLQSQYDIEVIQREQGAQLAESVGALAA
jgi:antitoxin HigA-1